MTRRAILACLLLPLTAAACSSPATEGGRPKIAFVQDLSAPDADEHALPALQALELAVAMQDPAGSEMEVVAFDLAGDPGVPAEIAQDPSFVAAIVGPGADGAALAEAGVPTVSVSTSGPTPTRGAWRRLVAPIEVVADTVAMHLEGTHPCVLSEEPPPDALAGLLAERLDAPVAMLSDPGKADAFIGANGCDTVVWAGSADEGADVAGALPAGVAFVGGDRLLDPDFVDVGPAGDGALATCSCVDLSTSVDPAAMRFNQDYQAQFGLAPGAYAVEAWDAATMLLNLILHDGPDRSDVGAALRDLRALEGLGGPYGFRVDGELADPAAIIASAELRDGRWVRGPGSNVET